LEYIVRKEALKKITLIAGIENTLLFSFRLMFLTTMAMNVLLVVSAQ
jgi:hypothetical protein